ncbi:hypothetical protein M0813_12986 [Anaeramoeba flamelloides]|uniref:BTB domain-containing protein n=1 Tax=Anaeramoeba flamelloides TaxID=1746091 RepID=A0ABQ8Z9X3_9EUKA|nr:hypothetical protein M0813_12986 [Anaeramoeba flamelloides]
MEQTQNNSYYFGVKRGFLTEQNNLSTTIHPITVNPKPKQICGGCSIITILESENKISVYEDNSKKSFTFENETVIKIAHSYFNSLVLTQSGKVYSIGVGNNYKQLPFENTSMIKNDKSYLIDFFEKQKIFIIDINCGSLNNFFISDTNDLYVNGFNRDGQLGGKATSHSALPVKLFENVDRVYCSPHGLHYFFGTNENVVYALGRGMKGNLGLGNKMDAKTTTVVPNIQANEVENITCGLESSAILFRCGEVFTTGIKFQNGLLEDTTAFKKLESLKDVNVISIVSGSYHTTVLTDQNEIYTWGKFSSTSLTSSILRPAFNQPTKIIDYSLPKNVLYELSSACYNTFIIPKVNFRKERSNLDFLILLENGKFSDHTFKLDNNINIKIHKPLVECRTKKTVEEIENILKNKNYEKEQIKSFLKWVYSGVIEDSTIVKEICEKIDLHDFSQTAFYKDLHLLFLDEDSKNFNLIIKENDDDEEEDDDDDEEEEDDYDVIPVHKFILYARSGLFREMFDKIEENSNSVTDYSGKTLESLEILIKFFYTNKIELTADDDPILIFDELKDSVEYYQLKKYSSLNAELNKIKNQLLKK